MRYAIAGAFCILLASAPAFADCNYNANNAIKNCQSAIKDWFSNTKNNQSQSSEDIQKRVDSARDTLNECINCATSQIDNATKSLGSSNTTDTESNPPDSDDPQN